MVRLSVYDAAGRLVRTLVEEPLSAGRHVIEWDGTDNRGGRVASGVYFYALSDGRRTLMRKALVLK